MGSTRIHQLLAMNRAEELGYDVWEHFVIPPYYERLSVGDTRKPKVIIGGRGCGKTMLLRYLAHESTFSPRRELIPPDALSHIGMYWRADTQFASLMQHRDVPDDTWAAAFRHLAAVVLGIEVLRGLASVASCAMGVASEELLQTIDFGSLGAFLPALPTRLNALRAYLEQRLCEFETWVNDVRSVTQPHFLPGQNFVKRMIVIIRDSVPKLRDAIFFVYIDEYENLATYQQRIINTWLKQSEPPLIFNLAMKRNGFRTRATEGTEALADIHDYRDIDIEDFDLEKEFPVFAAEILLLRLSLGNEAGTDIDPQLLRDPARLGARKQQQYMNSVLSTVKSLFPSLTHRDHALAVFADSALLQRLRDRVAEALKARQAPAASPDEYLLRESPEASIVVPALLHRQNLSVFEVKDELNRLRQGEYNKFTGHTDWIHNNFVGCYLQLYDGLVRTCPLYGGFETYTFMSRGNLRHFLELCHNALARSDGGDAVVGKVTVEMQAEAARQVAAELLPEVRSFGPQGGNLHTFLLRLGSLLSLSQKRLTQSEPERTHFSIQGGDDELTVSDKAFLSEAIKWSVIFEEKGTKKKSGSDPEGTEYVLNPIYAPYFHISYRKRRKLELPASEAAVLIRGSYEEVRRLLKVYQQRWAVDLPGAALPLFAHLDQESD